MSQPGLALVEALRSIMGEGGEEATLQPPGPRPAEGPARGPSSSWLWLCCSRVPGPLWSHGLSVGRFPRFLGDEATRSALGFSEGGIERGLGWGSR